MADSNTEQIEERIRQLAYRLWQEDGSPENRASEHWHRAAQQIAEQGESAETLAPISASPPARAPSFEEDYRSDFETNYAKSGAPYDDYQRAYSHGAALGHDEQYRGRDWHEIEPHARNHWESHYPNNAWERFKDAVRHGWEKVTLRF
jgi:hypothetical protein